MSQHSRIKHDHEFRFDVTIMTEPARFPHDRDPESIAAEIKQRVESALADMGLSVPAMAIEISGRCCFDDEPADGDDQMTLFAKRIVRLLSPHIRKNPIGATRATLEMSNARVPSDLANRFEFGEWVAEIYGRHGIDLNPESIADLIDDMELAFDEIDDDPAAVDWNGDDVGRRLDVDARHLLRMIHDAAGMERADNFPNAVAEVARQWKITTDNWAGIDDDRVAVLSNNFREWFAGLVRLDWSLIPEIDDPLVERRVL